MLFVCVCGLQGVCKAEDSRGIVEGEGKMERERGK